MKKALSLLLSLIMIISAISVSGFTLSAEDYSGTCGDGLTWTLDTETGLLEISGIGDMYDYDWNTSPWYNYAEHIKSLKIGDGVTSIGENAFYECYLLTGEVIIPDSVKRISKNAFYCCASLEGVIFGDSVVSIGENAFRDCFDLASVTISDSVTTIGSMAFYDCSSLKTVTIPETVTSIGESAFAYRTTTIMCYMDSYAHKYAKENDYAYGYKLLPRKIESGTCGADLTWTLDTETGMFEVNGTGKMYNYSEYEYVPVGSYYTNVPWEPFKAYIKTAIIGDSVTGIGNYAFFDFRYLESITIPESVTSIGDRALDNMGYGIHDVTVYCYEGSYAHTYAVNNEFSLELIVPDKYSGTCGDNLTWTLDTTTGVLDISGTGDMYNYNYTSAPWYSYRSNIKNVVIGDSVTSIGSWSFYSCSNLVNADIPDSVTSIGDSAFSDCHSLTSISIPDNVISIGEWAFSYCNKLISISIGKSLTSIGEFAFLDCPSLTDIYISDIAAWCGIDFSTINANPVTVAGRFCLNGSPVTDLVIPDSVESIGDYAFACCGDLTSVTIPPSVKNISSYAFTNSSAITVKCYKNSYAHTYAIENGFEYELLICDHVFTNYVSDNNYTCTEDGTKTAYCDKGCGETDTVVDEGSAGHRYTREEILREPTCEKQGYKILFCSCGARKNETLPIVDHVYTEYTYNNDATCTSDGTETAYCDFGCGTADTGSAEGTILDHSYTSYVYNNDATCTANGTETAYCDYDCGASDTRIAEGTKGPHIYTEEILDESTCTSAGFALYICDCGDFYSEDLPLKDHSYGDWVVVKEPTDTEAGEEQRTCSACGNVETKDVAKLPKPELTVDNYTITITNAEYIKDARYVLGTYTTTAEIRNAPGNVALDNKVIKNNTVDGSFVYDLPDGGVYSIWVRMTDGRNYILPIDMTKFTPAVDTYGVKITVDGLYDAKDFFIAKGQFNSYNEIKNNGYIVRVTENKIAGKHSYTYTVSDPGMHTVLVRYNDGTEHIFHENLTVDEPEFTTNGLQVTVSNIPDVKVIRTAYGEYYTPGDTKRAEGARNFSNKAVIKDAESYMLQYREEGRVTIIVEYNNGYVKVFHYDVVKKTPTVEQNENSVTFGDIDGLVMIRYAQGEYSTSAEIKRAPGSKVIKPDAIVDGKITVSDLTVDNIYTFCVQYDDESYCYYQSHIKVEQKDFTLNFNAEDGALVNNADLTYGINIGDKYSDIITELPVAEKEGYVFKGWWNRQRRIALTPDFDAQEVFDVYLKEGENLEYIDTTIELIPIWDTEGEKDWTLTFVNWEIDFEPIEIGMNVGDTFMSVFGGKFPDPGEKVIDFGDGDLYEFQGWMIDDPDIGIFLLSEGDMWDLGYLALAGNWVFEALYELV